ncbi:uncharacterized protein A1O9_01118 [Exophiala aquamarina CBS 119918]|uniref:U4/U6 snRNA-associated-splicing factor PRP24 n=1 Tax=Exophiala aquamarina CBS 119918 TaxID=1182545 RepID=A0A072PTR8_9EURO|nr:uncharacterized protein A1O9_01118 [Exophiala aquamarina CBS 119918]KEF63142.1 hypothetical protein A1O9_01118 [Exophiala aquamarina CBS 119918]
MDINSLLSPSDTPHAASPTPQSVTQSQSPFKHVQRTRSGTPSTQPALNSPLSRAIQPPSSIPAHVRSPSQQPAHSSPLISPVPTGTATHITRSSSTQSMDTLADLASLQNPRSTPPVLKSRDSSDSQVSSSAAPVAHLLSGATSNPTHPRTSFDIAMVETPKQALRLDYSDTSLSFESKSRLASLVAYIQETPSSYDGHKEIINILHQGFVNHIYPSSSPGARRDPRGYDLLPELRHARETFDKLFAVGEDQWLDWLQDESILAQTAEERVAVVDKCRRAVSEEYGSTSLWITYGEWVLHCYKWAQDSSGDIQGENVDQDRLIGREIFDWNLVLETWAEGILRTQLDLSRSHEVWDKYMNVRFGETAKKLSSSEAEVALELFQSRLRVPHCAWDQTFSSFSTFVSTNFPDHQYEDTMASTLRESAIAKKIWSDREALESALESARETGDQTAEYQAFSRYLEWERSEEERAKKNRKSKGKRDNTNRLANTLDMITPLYHRAELRFPSVLTIWEEHIEYLLSKSNNDVLLEVLARAAKHCPWSGSLWKQYLLTSELAEASFDQTESIKHKATSTGLLDAAGIEEALVVYDAWCGYLLRRTRRPESTEEDSDVAEMGIRSSIEAVHSLASTLGLSSDFDPSFRLQRKHVEYLKSQQRFDNARAQFDDSIEDYGKHYKFWLRFYEFELQKNVQMAISHSSSAERLAAVSSAPFAAGVLKQGLQYPGLDYPEPLIEALLNHCEDYEDADELQSALSLVHKVQKTLMVKRHQEALQAKEISSEMHHAASEVVHNAQEAPNGAHNAKRKREDDADNVEDPAKRYKSDETTDTVNEAPAAPEEESLKRDREHSSVLVQNLPVNSTETKIRQYFSSCGTVKHLKMLQDEDNSVIVEFEDSNAANFALTRDGREFEGSELSITLNTGSTLYVTNYIAAADETYIRNLMRPYGEIVSIRFPSLKKNKRRRFCYVEFKQRSEAQAATELDNRDIDGLEIVVKISDPTRRHARTENGEARTLFVGHIPFKATSKDIETAFAVYGKLEQIKLPQDAKAKSRNRGIAFVTYVNPEDAKAALALDKTSFQGRNITVNVAAEGGSRANRSVNSRSMSPSTQPDPHSTPMSKDLNADVVQLEDRRLRTVAISDVPDTVNESRIRAIAEKTGPVRKVILKTNHQGAVIEFEGVADAGKASIELDGYEIAPGRHIRVTTQREMRQQKPELKEEQFVKRPTAKMPATNGPVKRPAQPGARKGGHLGQRSATIFQVTKADASPTTGEQNEVKKTNEDFRSLVNKS